MSALSQIRDELAALDAQTSKVAAELTPVTRSFAITALGGVFADDSGISVGDVCRATVVRGRVGSMGTDGVWNGILPGTIVEYTVTHGGVESVPCVEAFYAA